MHEVGQILEKVRRFTETEVICLQQWLIEVLRGNLRKADDILKTGLQFEHIDAVLSEHPEERTPEQIAQFEKDKAAFLKALGPEVEVPVAIVNATHEPVSQDVR